MADQLHVHPLFQTRTELLSPEESIALSYQRARIFLRTHSESPLPVLRNYLTEDQQI